MNGGVKLNSEGLNPLMLPFSKTSASRDNHAYGLNSVGLERRTLSSQAQATAAVHSNDPRKGVPQC